MTKEEAQAILDLTIVVFTSHGDQDIGIRDDEDTDNTILKMPDGAHYVAPENVVEQMTIQEIHDLANS